MLRGGSRTFFAASLVLPRRVSDPAAALYAFCRLADDAVDVDGGRLLSPAHLRKRLSRAYEGRPIPHAVDRAFADTVARFAIPRALPEAILEGLEWDAAGRRYETLADLYDYAARVAGAVGAMMAVLMDVRSPDALARACDLGIAMQFTNIARDVGEDAREGRLYLPVQWLDEVGIDAAAWLAQPAFSAELGIVVRRLLAAADVLYRRADAGISLLPLTCRPGIRLARNLYAEIGRQIERGDCDSVAHRAMVPLWRKWALVASTLTAMTLPQQSEPVEVLEPARFLVDAAAPDQPDQQVACQHSPWRFDERIAWLVKLFERLEAADRVRS